MKKLIITLMFVCSLGYAQYPYNYRTEISASEYSSVNAAITSIGSKVCALLIKESEALTANLVIPSTMTLKILRSGELVKASTYTVTINGTFEAGIYKCFNGFSAGDITFASNSVKEIYSEWFGATGNGSTDDYAAIQSAHDAAASGQVLFFLAGRRYSISDTVEINKNIALYSPAYESATIEPSASLQALRFTGALSGTTTTLKDTLIPNMEYALATNTTGFTAGNTFTLLSDANWYYNIVSTQKKGELHKINSVNGDTLFIEGKTWDAYATGTETVTLAEINPISVSIRNLNIIYNGTEDSTVVGIEILYASNVHIENTKVSKAGNVGIQLKWCYNVDILNCIILETNRKQNGYGVSVASCANVNIYSSYFQEFRSAVDVTCAPTSFPGRSVNIHDNKFVGGGFNSEGYTSWSEGNTALSTHGPAEYVAFNNNLITEVYFGAKLRGSNITFSDNKLTGKIYYGVYLDYGNNIDVLCNSYDAGYTGRKNLSSPTDVRDLAMYSFVALYDSCDSDTNTYINIMNNSAKGLRNSFLQTRTSLNNVNVSNNSFSFHPKTPSDAVYTWLANSANTITGGCFINNDVYVNSGSYAFKNANATLKDCAVTYHRHSSDEFVVDSLRSSSATLERMNYATDAELSDAYIVVLSPVPSNYSDGFTVMFKANTANTGACSINVNSLGVKSLKVFHDQDPPDNYIEIGSIVIAVYDGTNFQVVSPDANP